MANKLGKPSNERELRIYSAGMHAGMRNYAMALAAQSKGDKRKAYLKSARKFHHIHLARVREARDATLGLTVGYYAPKFSTAPVDCGSQRKQVAA